MGFTPKNYSENMKATSFGKFLPDANSSYQLVVLTRDPARPEAALVEGRYCHDVNLGKNNNIRVRCTAPAFNAEYPETAGITECLICKEFYDVNRAIGAQAEIATKGMSELDKKAWFKDAFSKRQRIRATRSSADKTEGAYYAVAVAVFKLVDNKLTFHEVEIDGKKVNVPKYFIKYLFLSKKKFDAMVEDLSSSMAQAEKEFTSFGLVTLKTSVGDVKEPAERAKAANYTMALRDIPVVYPDIVPLLVRDAQNVDLTSIREFKVDMANQANIVGRLTLLSDGSGEATADDVAAATKPSEDSVDAPETPADDGFDGII